MKICTHVIMVRTYKQHTRNVYFYCFYITLNSLQAFYLNIDFFFWSHLRSNKIFFVFICFFGLYFRTFLGTHDILTIHNKFLFLVFPLSYPVYSMDAMAVQKYFKCRLFINKKKWTSLNIK